MPPHSVSPKDKQRRGVQGLHRPRGLELWVSRAGRSLSPCLQAWHRLRQDKQDSCPRGRAPVLPQRLLLSDHYNWPRYWYFVHPVLIPGTFTLSPTIISWSVSTHISTVKLARKEKESSLSRSRLHSPSSAASSRRAEAAC